MLYSKLQQSSVKQVLYSFVSWLKVGDIIELKTAYIKSYTKTKNQCECINHSRSTETRLCSFYDALHYLSACFEVEPYNVHIDHFIGDNN